MAARSGEEAGFAVLFGFELVMDPAEGFDVDERCLAAIGDGVDVVTLEVILAIATWSGAGDSVERRRRP
jgi:hypothetical protein